MPPMRERLCSYGSFLCAVGLVGFVFSATARAATVPSGFIDESFVTGLSQPTAMAFAPDGRLFVCEKSGQLRVVKNGALLATPFLSVPVFTNGESGLLGIAFDPDFEANRSLYVYYTANTTPRQNRVSRFQASLANPDVAESGSELVILGDIPSDSPFGNHQGGGLHFGSDGMLYVAIGDDNASARSQQLGELSGKLLRIDPSGFPSIVPNDNPFVGTAGARGEIWALGLRNPFTFAVDPATGRMHINDVGASSSEEINVGAPGSNYGWPLCEGLCGDPRFVEPFFAYPDGAGAAIAGGAFYRGGQFPSEYFGDYFFGDYVKGFIQRLEVGASAFPFAEAVGSVVDLDVGPDESLYYLIIGSGSVRKIRFQASSWRVLDGLGGVHGATGSPAPYFGSDFARDLELATTGFYVLDGLGGVHAGGGASVMSPGTPYFGFDIAEDLELASIGSYVLDGFGGLHPGGGATTMSPGTPYFGFDIARDFELASTGYYVLDGFGGVHAGGGAVAMSPVTPYFGFDIARDMELASTGFYVLDGLGGIHAGGGAQPPQDSTPYFGIDIARDMELASTGFYVLDGMGGVHVGDQASPFVPTPPYFGFDIARDLELQPD